MKRKFLAVYDYGTGGGWYVILARSKQEIVSKFRELEVFDYDKPPETITRETYESIVSDPAHDIDDPPTGSLAMFLRND